GVRPFRVDDNPRSVNNGSGFHHWAIGLSSHPGPIRLTTPGRILHDLRRSAVRNMERRGLSRSAVMQLDRTKPRASIAATPSPAKRISAKASIGSMITSWGQIAGTKRPRAKSRPRKLLIPLQAGVAELADAQDLKSWVPKGACGFDPRPRHQIAEGILRSG